MAVSSHSKACERRVQLLTLSRVTQTTSVSNAR